jgi:hypothetical protein
MKTVKLKKPRGKLKKTGWLVGQTSRFTGFHSTKFVI